MIQKFGSNVGTGRCWAESRLNCCMNTAVLQGAGTPGRALTASKLTVRAPSTGETGRPNQLGTASPAAAGIPVCTRYRIIFPLLPLIRWSPQTLSRGQQTTASQKNTTQQLYIYIYIWDGCKRCNRDGFLSHALSCNSWLVFTKMNILKPEGTVLII